MSKKITRNQVKKLAKTVNEKLIIDGLWRDPLWLYNETMLSATSAEKADAQSELYDQHYVYLENSFLDETSIDVSYATVLGFGNLLKADFSHVTGYGNETTSFCETIIGPYGFIPLDQIKDAWVITDRLFTVANGTGTNAEQRHDALNIYKSGYIEAYNALTLGLYSHGETLAGNGTIQYNPETGLEFRHRDEWVVVGGSGDIRKTFISLDDTMDSYLELGVSTRGWGMVVSPFSDSVISAKAFGITSAPQFYIRHCCPAFIAGDNIISNGDFISNLNGWIAGTNWAWYNGVAAHAPGSTEPIKQELTGIDNRAMKATFTVIVNAGSITVSITNRESFQITESGTFSRYFTGSVLLPAYIIFTPSSDFDGQIDDVELIPESSSSMGDAPLLLKDISNNTVQEIKWPGNNLLIGNNIANQLTSGASGNMICAPGSLVNLQTGSNITAIGHSLGATVVTSSGHVLLGYGVDVPDDNNDGYMVIGNGVTDFIRGYAENIEIAGGLKINADSSTAWIQFPVTPATKFNSILLGGSTSETLGNLAWSPYSMPALLPLEESFFSIKANGDNVYYSVDDFALSTELIDSFIELNDTPSTYPTTGRGNSLIAGSSGVLFSNYSGSDNSGAWMLSTSPTYYDNIIVTVNSDFASNGLGWTFSNNWSWNSGKMWMATGTLDRLSQTINCVAGRGYRIYLNGQFSDGQIRIRVDETVLLTAMTYTSQVDDTYNAYYYPATTGPVTISLEAYITDTLNPAGNVDDFAVFECYYTNQTGPRVVDENHNTRYWLPATSGQVGDVVTLGVNGQLVYKSVDDLISNYLTDFAIDLISDEDFATAGLMKTDGNGNYSTITDNSALWNQLKTLGKKEYWNGTQIEYDAILTKDSNTIYFINEE